MVFFSVSPFSAHPLENNHLSPEKSFCSFFTQSSNKSEFLLKFSRTKSGFFHDFSRIPTREKIHFFPICVVLILACFFPCLAFLPVFLPELKLKLFLIQPKVNHNPIQSFHFHQKFSPVKFTSPQGKLQV